jgi:hypothetical protein
MQQPTDLLLTPQIINTYRALVEWYWQGKPEELGEKTCPSATLSPRNPTWTGPSTKPGFRGEKQVTNRLSHDTAKLIVTQLVKKFSAFLKFQSSLSCSQKPITSPYPSPVCTLPQYFKYDVDLIVSFRLRLDLPSCHFPSGFTTKIWMQVSFPLKGLHVPGISTSLRSLYSTWWEVQPRSS